MTNGEKYKTVKERLMAFKHFCESHHECEKCPLVGCSNEPPFGCVFGWLEMKSYAELLPCPFCGGSSVPRRWWSSGLYCVQCDNCNSHTGNFNTEAEAIAAWNRRAK